MGLEASEKTLAILAKADSNASDLQRQVAQVGESATRLGRSGEELERSIAATLTPAQESLRSAASTLDEASRAIPGLLATSAATFVATAEQLRSTLSEELGPATRQLHKAVRDDLRPAAERHNQVLQDASRVSNGLQELFDRVLGSSKTLEEWQGHLKESATRQSRVNEEIHEGLKKRLIPAQEALSASADRLADSAGTLARFVAEGVGPATSRLTELAAVIGPMREAAHAIGALGDLKGELGELAGIVGRLRAAVDSARTLADLQGIIEQLTQSFARADELRQTITSLPDQFATHLNALSRDALRYQADELKEVLFDIAKQFALVHADASGPHR